MFALCWEKTMETPPLCRRPRKPWWKKLSINITPHIVEHSLWCRHHWTYRLVSTHGFRYSVSWVGPLWGPLYFHSHRSLVHYISTSLGLMVNMSIRNWYLICIYSVCQYYYLGLLNYTENTELLFNWSNLMNNKRHNNWFAIGVFSLGF